MTPGGTATEAMEAWGLPFINTIILVTSSVTVTFAHWALKKNRRLPLQFWLAITVILGATFVALQAVEYIDAYNELGLTLGSGIYGSTFFMLTGFHGAHVTLGATMLAVMWLRTLKGHFTPDNHFAFEAASWYWHFVDVIWLFLFTFVYWFYPPGIMNLVTNPYASRASNSAANATRTLSEITVRWVLPLSRTRNTRPLPRLTMMPNRTNRMRMSSISYETAVGVTPHRIKSMG